MDMGKEIFILNIYGPYSDGVEYWEKLFNTERVHSGLVVIGRDINFSLGASKIWGLAAHMDCLLRHFIRNMEAMGVLDIEPSKLTLAWGNKRIGESKVAKGIDLFLISKIFMNEVIQVIKWVSLGGDSNYNLIVL